MATIQQVADEAVNEVFVDGWFEQKVKDGKEVEAKDEALGVRLSQYAEYDGLRILKIAYSALEDANFHTEAAQVEEMIKKIEEE